ncbi:AT-rich interactive domain-containing protein 1B-like [Moschus berezovskii]|uniref:AT-rich interactive domain-containing protein 1B-like n=1 Tax=Moschus berezovskii TaxID=68408 RepID=UPI002444BAC6|nr:AT-rich interactive domain-containing protein 1B-like [Moschus berezovskii]
METGLLPNHKLKTVGEAPAAAPHQQQHHHHHLHHHALQQRLNQFQQQQHQHPISNNSSLGGAGGGTPQPGADMERNIEAPRTVPPRAARTTRRPRWGSRRAAGSSSRAWAPWARSSSRRRRRRRSPCPGAAEAAAVSEFNKYYGSAAPASGGPGGCAGPCFDQHGGQQSPEMGLMHSASAAAGAPNSIDPPAELPRRVPQQPVQPLSGLQPAQRGRRLRRWRRGRSRRRGGGAGGATATAGGRGPRLGQGRERPVRRCQSGLGGCATKKPPSTSPGTPGPTMGRSQGSPMDPMVMKRPQL